MKNARLNIKRFSEEFPRHLRTHLLLYVSLVLLALMFGENYRIGINQSPSLPQTLFLIHRNEYPKKGDYVAFHPPVGTPFGSSAILTKIVIGQPGDVITVVGRDVFVNGSPVGTAKTLSRKGEPLHPILPGVIPPDLLYVMGLHPDSLDSRYTLLGLVPRSAIVGRAWAIW